MLGHTSRFTQLNKTPVIERMPTLGPCTRTLCFIFSLVRQVKGHDSCVERFLIPERLLINVGIC